MRPAGLSFYAGGRRAAAFVDGDWRPRRLQRDPFFDFVLHRVTFGCIGAAGIWLSILVLLKTKGRIGFAS
jgi:hypothetical protein